MQQPETSAVGGLGRRDCATARCCREQSQIAKAQVTVLDRGGPCRRGEQNASFYSTQTRGMFDQAPPRREFLELRKSGLAASHSTKPAISHEDRQGLLLLQHFHVICPTGPLFNGDAPTRSTVQQFAHVGRRTPSCVGEGSKVNRKRTVGSSYGASND
jgi:hypothetical protein